MTNPLTIDEFVSQFSAKLQQDVIPSLVTDVTTTALNSVIQSNIIEDEITNPIVIQISNVTDEIIPYIICLVILLCVMIIFQIFSMLLIIKQGFLLKKVATPPSTL